MLLDERNLRYKLSVCKYFCSPSVYAYIIKVQKITLTDRTTILTDRTVILAGNQQKWNLGITTRDQKKWP